MNEIYPSESGRDGLNTLVSLFRPDRDSRPILLLGAGASYRSGIPLAGEAVRLIAKAAYARNSLGKGSRSPSPKVSDWMSYLQAQPWFISGENRLAENYPLVIEKLLVPTEFRRDVLMDLIEPRNGISSGYQRLADLVQQGLLHTVLTTNFDRCLPEVLNARRPQIRHVAQVNRSRGDFAEFSVYPRCQIVWLHGCVEQYTDRNLVNEVEALDREVVDRLRPLISDSPVIVVGYRGAEQSIMNGLLAEGADVSQKFRHGLYWCTRSGDRLHPSVGNLAKKIGSNFRHIEIDGFDELMEHLSRELKNETSRSSDWQEKPNRLGGYDETTVPGATLADLDTSLMMSVLSKYCETFGRNPLTKESLGPLLHELDLLITVDNVDVPTVGAILLFGRNTSSYFPHSVVALTTKGKKRILFQGNLIQQQSDLVEYFASENTNPVVRVKGDSRFTERSLFPSRGLNEMIVNMLIHRDYSIEELSEIDIDPGVSITFSNPGGLFDDLSEHLEIDQRGRFEPKPSLSRIRNPSVADVFFGYRRIEKAGTGLVHTSESMREYAGAASFCVPTDNQTFMAALWQSPQDAGNTNIVRPLHPLGVYILNHWRFGVFPERLSRFSLKVGVSFADVLHNFSDRLPICIRDGQNLWSFAPPESILSILRGKLQSDYIEEIEIEKLIGSDRQRYISWLIRKHWEFYLRAVGSDGLIIDGRKRRAYFGLQKGNRNTICYDSAKRRNVKRGVVKQRGKRPKWFENEGIGYDVLFSDGSWGLRIKPFYMFTGKDGLTPLPGYERSRRSTRRMKFDRNHNVDSDLAFWSRYLSHGQTTIDIGGLGVDNLVLDSEFVVVEVPEFGLLEEHYCESADRLSA